jgi:hypothetical protein
VAAAASASCGHLPASSIIENSCLLFKLQDNPRTTACRVVAKANNLDLELAETAPASGNASYKAISPLDKIPAFVGANGFVLTECIAIAVYRESHLLRVAVYCAFSVLFALLFMMSHYYSVIPGRIDFKVDLC